jgi:hypothetical protein
VVKDAVADWSEEHMHSALDINIPNFTTAIVTTGEIVDACQQCQPSARTRG